MPSKRRKPADALRSPLPASKVAEVRRELEPGPRARAGVAIFVRMPAELNARLRRFALEQQLAGRQPADLQGIIAAAVAAYLDQHDQPHG